MTASQQGRPLYEKHGFVVVDQVERWALPAGWRVECDATDGAEKLNRLLQADRSIWGECRSVLLSHLAENSSVFACGDSVALLQQGPDLQMIGPWYGGAASARMLLQQLVAAAKPSRELVVDLIGSSVLQPVLANFGFHCCGRNQLMARGKFHEIELQGMVSLASLGSVG